MSAPRRDRGRRLRIGGRHDCAGASGRTQHAAQVVRERHPLPVVPAPDYDPTRRWPLLLFLHGAGERGDDLDQVAFHGPPRLVREATMSLPFIIVSPQVPEDRIWSTPYSMRCWRRSRQHTPWMPTASTSPASAWAATVPGTSPWSSRTASLRLRRSAAAARSPVHARCGTCRRGSSTERSTKWCRRRARKSWCSGCAPVTGTCGSRCTRTPATTRGRARMRTPSCTAGCCSTAVARRARGTQTAMIGIPAPRDAVARGAGAAAAWHAAALVRCDITLRFWGMGREGEVVAELIGRVRA
jgi:hypothetical protein